MSVGVEWSRNITLFKIFQEPLETDSAKTKSKEIEQKVDDKIGEFKEKKTNEKQIDLNNLKILNDKIDEIAQL